MKCVKCVWEGVWHGSVGEREEGREGRREGRENEEEMNW